MTNDLMYELIEPSLHELLAPSCNEIRNMVRKRNENRKHFNHDLFAKIIITVRNRNVDTEQL